MTTLDERLAQADADRATVTRLEQLADDADRRVNASWVHTNEIRRALRGPTT